MTNEPLTIRELRRLWKPHKERFTSLGNFQPTPIRFHRACSWLAEAELLIDRNEYDSALIHQWIGFNALYSRWDAVRQEPLPDRQTWIDFLRRIVELDRDSLLSEFLQERKPQVFRLLENGYLTKYFWRDPHTEKAASAGCGVFKVRDYYLAGKWHLVLEEILDRVYLLRCQIMHGAASRKSELNRVALSQCVELLDEFLKLVLFVWAQHGYDQDWGPLCYPPIKNTAGVSTRNVH